MRMHDLPEIINREQPIAEEEKEEEKVATIQAKTKLFSFQEMINRRQKIGLKSFKNVFTNKKSDEIWEAQMLFQIFKPDCKNQILRKQLQNNKIDLGV